MRVLVQALAFALLALVGAEYALPGLHFASVKHQICAEHGELEHAELAPSSLHDDVDRPSTPAVFGSAGAAQHAHDSCSVWTMSASSALVDRGRGEPPVMGPETRPTSAVGQAAAKRSVDVLSYAPKLAPPV